MKEMKLTISRPRLHDEVSRLTAYLGAKQAPVGDSGSHYDRVAVIKADNPLLIRFTNEAVSPLAERLKGIVAAIDLGGDAATEKEEAEISVSLSLSDSYDDSLSVAVAENFEAYMTASVVGRWLRLVQPDKEAMWSAEAQRLLNEITSALYHRNPPRRN